MHIFQNRLHRMAPPQSGLGTEHNFEGRRYDGTAAGYRDVPGIDVARLQSAGWTLLGLVGTSSGRPTLTEPTAAVDGLPTGYPYIDTTLGKVVMFDRAARAWRDPMTGLSA